MPSIPVEVTDHRGLATDVPSVAGPPGAMRACKNASCHRPGLLQPRLGINGRGAAAARTSTFRVQHIVPWSEGVALWSTDGGSGRLEDRATTTVMDADAAPLTPAKGDPVFAESRGSLYYCCTGGIRRITGPTAAAEVAGIRTNYYVPLWNPGIAVSGTEFVLAGSRQAAYRFVWVRQDENGYERRSAPSSRMVVRNDSADNWAIVFDPILIPLGVVAGDRLEVYRTRATPTTTTPPEDYYLAFTHEVDGAEVTARITVSLTDNVNDDLLGVTLYASASQQGILQAKESPPHAHTMAWWSDVMWYGDVVERPAVTVDIVKKMSSDGQFNDGLQSHRFEGSVSLGSNVISGIANVAGIVVGMGLSERLPGVLTSPAIPGTYLPADTTVTAIGGVPGAHTITMSANALAGAGAIEFQAGDVVTVDGVPFYCMPGLLGSASNPNARAFQDFQFIADVTERNRRTANAIAQAVSAYTEILDPTKVYAINNDDGSVTFRRPQGILAPFTVTSTRPAAFRPALEGNLTAAPGAKTNRLYFSQPQEPEAVPLVNFLDIGQENLTILALTPLDDAMLVWTDEGLFRVTGYAPGNWVVDELDQEVRLVHPRAHTVFQDVAYAWTDRGVVVANQQAVSPEPVSTPIAPELRPLQQFLVRKATLPARGLFMTADHTLGDVILGVPGSLSADGAGRSFVYNVFTGRWSTWERADRTIGYSQLDDMLLAVPAVDAWQLGQQRRDENQADSYYDTLLTSLTATTITGAEVVVAKTLFEGFVPKAGDLLEDATGWVNITAVVDGGANWEMTTSRTPNLGATVDWAEGYETELVWQGVAMRPAIGALWQEVHAAFTDAGHALLTSYDVELGGAAHRSADPVYAPVSVDQTSFTLPLRQGVSRDVARTPHFFPALRVSSPGAFWRLGALTVFGEPASRRVSRR